MPILFGVGDTDGPTMFGDQFMVHVYEKECRRRKVAKTVIHFNRLEE